MLQQYHAFPQGHLKSIDVGFSMNDFADNVANAICSLQALLVEDDELDAEIFKTIGGMNGECAIHFTHARTLDEAARILERRKFDLYFVDLCVGEGMSLTLLANLEMSGARPVVVSNLTLREAEQYRLNQGGVRFLAKGDCSPTRIGALAREALRARQTEARQVA
jgi:DNA-binding NtrC family response regulator